MYKRDFRQNIKRLRRIDKFNALISGGRKVINDVNRKNNNSIRLLNKFRVNKIYMMSDMIEKIIDYITRKRNNKKLKMTKMTKMNENE